MGITAGASLMVHERPARTGRRRQAADAGYPRHLGLVGRAESEAWG